MSWSSPARWPARLAYQVWEWTRSTCGIAAAIDRSAPNTRRAALAPSGIVLRVRGRALARLAHALHVDVDQLAQLRHQLGHVHPGAAVDRGWILPGQQRDDSRSVVWRRHECRIVPQRTSCDHMMAIAATSGLPCRPRYGRLGFRRMACASEGSGDRPGRR